MCVQDSGKRISWCGVIVISATLVAVVAVIWPVLTHRRPRPNPDGYCLNKLKQLGTAMHMYEADYGGLPVLLTTAQRVEKGGGRMPSRRTSRLSRSLAVRDDTLARTNSRIRSTVGCPASA